MPISIDEVKHLAHLARISIDDDSINTYAEHMDKILEYFNILDRVELKDVKYYTLKHMDEFRDDEVIECKEDVLAVAKNLKDRFIKAPRIV